MIRQEVDGVAVLHGAVELEDEGDLFADDVCLEVAADDAPPGEALDGAARWHGGVGGHLAGA